MPWNKGKPWSNEMKRKISEAKTGKPLSEETKAKMRGRIPWNKGKRGLQTPWNKGIPRSEETKRKVSETKKRLSKEGKLFNPVPKGSKRPELAGPKHYRYGKKLPKETIAKIKATKATRSLPRFTKEDLEFFYHGKGMSIRDVAKKKGCSVPTINYWMNRLGIKKRRIVSIEIRNKMSESSKKKWNDKKFRLKHKKIMQKVYSNPKYIKKKKKIMSIVNRNPEKIEKQRVTILEGYKSGRIVPWITGLTADSDPRVASIREKQTGRTPWNKGLTKNDPRIAKYIKYGKNHPMYGKKQTKKSNMKRSLKSKMNWKDKNYVKRVIKTRSLKPNKAEQILYDILQKNFPNQWKYVGDFSFQVDGRYPDFIHNNGRKMIIELFGNYFHKGEDGSERVQHYANHGYKTLIIWASELRKSIKVVKKVRTFMK